MFKTKSILLSTNCRLNDKYIYVINTRESTQALNQKAINNNQNKYKINNYENCNLFWKSRYYWTLNYKQNNNLLLNWFNKRSFNSGHDLICINTNGINICHKRYVSTNIPSKLKSIQKTECQQRLAHLQSKSPINSFPLIKEENFDFNQFSNQFKELLELIKICEENNLNNSLYFPSVSTVLNTTMSVQSMAALEKWKKLKISELGDEGFRNYQKGLLNRGRALHLNIKNFIATKDSSVLTITQNIEKLWKSLEHVLQHISDVKLCETPVSHPYLCYKGIVDCVAAYKGRLVVIEWKTSEKLKPTLNHIYDNPLQAVAYLGAINYEINHCLQTNEIVLIYAYEDGSDAQIHYLNADQCQQYWKQWLTRLKSYWDVVVFKQSYN